MTGWVLTEFEFTLVEQAIRGLLIERRCDAQIDDLTDEIVAVVKEHAQVLHA